ncbi:hypothetical protein C8R47DRAFT_1228062 [Mycena vitilis]|nr:hypothetical protein C8R47DRAFT_1228062 [Mycena vitilis]
MYGLPPWEELEKLKKAAIGDILDRFQNSAPIRRWWRQNDLSCFPAVLHNVFSIEGKPRPLAFYDADEVDILFAVGAEYHFCNGEDSELHRLGSDFTFDTDFLLRIKDADGSDELGLQEDLPKGVGVASVWALKVGILSDPIESAC